MPVYRYALRRRGDPATAEDVVADLRGPGQADGRGRGAAAWAATVEG